MGGLRLTKAVHGAIQVGLLAAGFALLAAVVVLPASAQSPLTIVTSAFPPGVVGVPYTLQLQASGGTAPYTWAVQPIVTLPTPGQIAPGVLIDAKTGLVSGTPASSGTFSFTLTLTDAANGATRQIFQFVVTPAGPLGITTTALPQGTVGVKYSQQLSAKGGTPPYKWSVASGALPAGLSLDAVTGLISGTPASTASGPVTFGLTDSASPPGSAQQAIQITIVNPPALAITTASLKGGFNGAAYQDQVAATGGIPPYKWAISGGALPPGLSLDSISGAITGRPTAAGTSSFTIKVTDSGALNASATQTYSIVIATVTAVTVAAQTLPDAVVNTPYLNSLVAGGGAPPYTWVVFTGTVPPGMALSTSGALQGLPTAAGTFTFDAQATDSVGGSAASYVTVNVKAAPVSVQVDTPPSGMVGVPYPAQAVTGAGGVGPHTFAVSSGTLPPGLTLTDGILDGMPTAAGSFNFTITATDSNTQGAATGSVPLTIVIRPAQTDIALSTGSITFSLNAGAASLPAGANVVVSSTSATTVATFSVSVSPAAPWLTVTGGASGATPTSYTVSLNTQALALAPSTTPYKTNVVFTCVTPVTCAGYTTQSVTVSLTVNSGAPQFLLTKQLVSLTATGSGLVTESFGVQNAGGGTLTINGATPADGWLAVSGLAATVGGGGISTGTITVNPNGFAPGYYRSNIRIDTSAGTANLPVTVLVASTGFINLNPGGQLFQMSQGGAVGNPNGLFAVTVQGTVSVSFGAALLPGASWLTLNTTSGTATAATPGTVSFSISPSVASLAPKVYYGTIRVTSGQVANSPQDFLVVLKVGDPDDPVTIDPTPGGLVFVAQGSAPVPSQTVQIFEGSTAAAAYEAATSTAGGKNWLSVTPNVGSARAGAPGTATVSVSQSGLAPDIYRGTVTYSTSPASARTVNVTFIVAPIISYVLSGVGPQPHALNCSPTSLVPTSNFGADFSQPVAFPVSVVVQLADNCGTAVGTGTVDLTFPTANDPPLALRQDPTSPGRFFGTWVPRKAASQVAVGLHAQAAGFPPVTILVTGKVVPNSVPVLTPQGTSNAFSGNPGGVAPGTAVQIYGSYLAPPGTAALASSVPFQTTLAGTSVLIGGIPAPLYFVSPGQINALVPLELPSGSQAQIIVNTPNGPTTPDPVSVPPATPGIAAFASGVIIAQHAADFSLVAPALPAKPGETVIIYLAGLGSAVNQPASGSPAPAPPTDPKIPATLTLNGTVVPASFAGLTPGAVGLYQINFVVPDGTPDGNLTLAVAQNGLASNLTILPVKR
jgi:uncharacterized protein (TIGR03437 family)